MPTPLTTPRLRLDPWSPADADLLGTLALTPAVVRHIGDGAPWTDARVQDVSAHNVEHWRVHGFGWRVIRLADAIAGAAVGGAAGAAVGFIMLGFAGEGAGIPADDHEIGWWLAPRVWGRGLAREGAAALRDEAFQRVGAPGVAARIQPANRASLAVAAAIGLTPAGESVGRGGEPIAVLRMSAADWAAQGDRRGATGAGGWPRPARRDGPA